MGLPSARSPPGRYDTHALQPTGEFHRCLTGAIAPGTQLPTGATLLFGRGGGVLDDTRFGEYQLGMAVRFSLASFRSAKEERQAAVSGTSAAFEQRIADAMAREGIAYFGRLVMRVRSRPLPPAGAPPSFDFSPVCCRMRARNPTVNPFPMGLPRAKLPPFHVPQVDTTRWITMSRYGSLAEAHAGTALVRVLCADEMQRWFSSYETILGTASRLLDI